MNFSIFESVLFTMLFLAAASHSIFLAILLFIKSRKELGLIWLGIMMIPICFWLLNYVLYIDKIILKIPHWYGVTAPILYLIGPLFYFFVRQCYNLSYRLRWYDALHILPFVFILWKWIPVYGWSTELKIDAVHQVYSMQRPSSVMKLFSLNQWPLFTLGYIIATYFILNRKIATSKIKNPRLLWLLRFTLLFAIIFIIRILMPFVFWIVDLNLNEGVIVELTIAMLIVVGIHALGYVVLGRDKILPQYIITLGNGKYATSPLTPKEITLYKNKIIEYLESEERPWLNKNFSFSQLVNLLEIPQHYVSQILNEGLNTNFYDLINTYRVHEVKKRLHSKDLTNTYTILGIALDCGFGSKSSFNRAFKKVTGETPTQWIQANILN